MKTTNKTIMKWLILSSFFACIITSINVFVYNYYYLKNVYKNVYTADGEWILSVDKLLGYFGDKVGLILSITNFSVIIAVLILYLISEIKDKHYEKTVFKEMARKKTKNK